jgi:hypothetical protein
MTSVVKAEKVIKRAINNKVCLLCSEAEALIDDARLSVFYDHNSINSLVKRNDRSWHDGSEVLDQRKIGARERERDVSQRPPFEKSDHLLVASSVKKAC